MGRLRFELREVKAVYRLDKADPEHLLPQVVHGSAGKLTIAGEDPRECDAIGFIRAGTLSGQDECRERVIGLAGGRCPRRLVAVDCVQIITASRIVLNGVSADDAFGVERIFVVCP